MPVSSASAMNSAGGIVPRVGMRPAHQRLEPGDRLRLEVDDRLIVEVELSSSSALRRSLSSVRRTWIWSFISGLKKE